MTDRIDAALNLIATRDHRISISELAQSLGMSPFGLVRMFTATLGIAPGAYMRRARLQSAAAVLRRDPSVPLVELALDAGFESQQTFTRAFTRHFGLSPGQYRKEATMPTTTATIEVTTARLSLPPLRVAGFAVTVDGDNGVTARQAWAALDPRLPVPGQEPGYTVGVCWQTIEDESFTYMAGVVLQHGAAVPPGMEVREVPAQTYAEFRQYMAAAAFAPQLRAGLEAIWAEHLPATGATPSGGPDMEIYPDELIAGQTAGWLTYRIPVA